jgi:hypothetical protein
LLECGVYLDDDDIRDILPVIETQCKKLRVFWQSLNFKKVGLGSCADNIQEFNRVTPPTNIPYIFDNCIRTDGHTIEFLFGKKKADFESLPDLTMSDLADLNLEDFHVYGVDPGHKHWITAVDVEGYLGVNENQNCVQFSNNEWYVKAGAIFRRKEQQEMKMNEGISAIESEIPSRKTADPDTFAYACQYLFDHLGKLTSFYGFYFTNSRFLAYIGQQKMVNEIVNIFVSGGKKYKHRIRHE